MNEQKAKQVYEQLRVYSENVDEAIDQFVACTTMKREEVIEALVIAISLEAEELASQTTS